MKTKANGTIDNQLCAFWYELTHERDAQNHTSLISIKPNNCKTFSLISITYLDFGKC